jgi:ubiquinone biosynthesis protein Coq4
MEETVMAEVSQADFDYYNGAIKKIETDSSVLVSSSPYLNNATLRTLISQEMLRRNGADVPNTGYIPEVAQILHQLENHAEILRLFEEEKQRLPVFREWLEGRKLADFKVEDVKDCAPGTLGAVIYDFLANSGYNMDHFFQGMKIETDFDFYLKQRTLTHDIEHMITGFETDHAGEIALLAANARAFYQYFVPELAAFFNRVGSYLKARTVMRSGLFYPKAFKIELDAEDLGAAQGRNWKMPLMLLPYRDMIHRQVSDIRTEYGITPTIPSGEWKWTTAVSEDPREGHEPMAMAAE